jgi:hypothetical protein
MTRTTISPSNLRRQARRRITKKAGVIAALGVASLGTAGTIVASAAVPEFPNNLVVFPNRDFITVEGFQDHVGETALVEVTRGDKVIGSAKAVVAAGDVAFEINHPGGVCWGNETTHQVTPDIKGGDKVSIKFAGDPAGDTTVQDVYVGSTNYVPGATEFTVTGHIGAGVSPTQLEQRIVNPDLTDTAVGRRDIRATLGPLTPAPKGGYSSSLSVTGETFTATYDFGADGADMARTAATGGGERIMAWEFEDADANRQGLTIAEAGEPGGPGMGGCPAGPTDQGAPKPGAAAALRSKDGTSIQVDWTPATAQPGAADVTGYSVVAIGTANADGVKAQVGNVTPAAATGTSISGLDARKDYMVEVRSMAGPKMSDAFEVELKAPPADPTAGDTVPPTAATADPAPLTGGEVKQANSVTLSTTEAGVEIYYTTNGDPVLTGDLPSDSAKLATDAGIPITGPTQLNWVAIDQAGNTTLGSGSYAPVTVQKPAPPVLGGSTAGQESITARWSTTDTSITGYRVQVYDAAGTEVGGLRPTTAKSLTVDGLTAGQPYTFKVQAENSAGWGELSAASGPLTPTAKTDRITITSARWKAGDFRVVGTGNELGVTVTVKRASNGAVLGQATVVAAAPPGVGDYSLRLRNNAAPATNPGQIVVESSRNGKAGPFTVSG